MRSLFGLKHGPALLLSLLLSACATPPGAPVRTQSIMDKQYAASGVSAAMPAREAVIIQKKYDEKIGQPLPESKTGRVTDF